MAWTPPPSRKRNSNVLFAVNYADGRSAYITLSPKKLESGDHLVPAIARELQEKGEIPRRDQGREAGAVIEHKEEAPLAWCQRGGA